MIELNLSKSTKITDTQRAYSLSQWGYELEMADIFRSCNDKGFFETIKGSQQRDNSC